MSKKANKPRPAPSSNWLALQKVLPKKHGSSDSGGDLPRKRRKLEHSASPPRPAPRPAPTPVPVVDSEPLKNGESIPALRRMIFGDMEYTDVQRQPGKFLALDCEMVGVGPEGVESSLARVSLVNYYGAVQLDAFVRQRERVVDYRTQYSGVRETDMVNARPFDEIQKQVAELLTDRVLVGHAVFNDLKVLLLSHPRPQTRDTQQYAGRFKVVKSKYVALRTLVLQELGCTIQGGEHSSVTDARATMAVYRLHRREWERGSAPLRLPSSSTSVSRDADPEEEDDEDEQEEAQDEEGGRAANKGKKDTGSKTKGKESFPGGGRKGVSSGLGVVVRRGSGSGSAPRGGKGGGGGGGEWWKELGAKKGSMRV
ncbi:ribonuclease H-like domain-containing protein [Mycena rebaudengoi]|nr:ribonuclease H-like domain-containing protein [Mycena rebaudengoi]